MAKGGVFYKEGYPVNNFAYLKVTNFLSQRGNKTIIWPTKNIFYCWVSWIVPWARGGSFLVVGNGPACSRLAEWRCHPVCVAVLCLQLSLGLGLGLSHPELRRYLLGCLGLFGRMAGAPTWSFRQTPWRLFDNFFWYSLKRSLATDRVE